MNNHYQVGIVGAGLAGLSLAIQLARKGFSVVLFEKKKFPFHKLCGEYLSNESVPFLKSLGVDIDFLAPAHIDKLWITNASGKSLRNELPLGGIGLSRYRLDHVLYFLAKENGVNILENTLVSGIQKTNNQYVINNNHQEINVDIVINSFGKQSNLSKINKRNDNNENQYIGVKYHIKLEDFPKDVIAIHNFKNGYCGVCRVEDDLVSLCYLSHTENLKASGNKIKQMEEDVLFKNKEVRQVFDNALFLNEKPITVSNIDFRPKSLIHDEIFFCGDAAGLITPLCGNGMSMALHGSYILGKIIPEFLHEHISFEDLCVRYGKEWRSQFQFRMAAGRKIQAILKNENVADWALSTLNAFPYLNKQIIRLTHGKSFIS